MSDKDKDSPSIFEVTDELKKWPRTKLHDKYRNHTAALGIGLISLIIGVPLWWKTTEVYRVSLPYSDIQKLSESKIKYVNEIEVIWAAGEKPDSLLSLLATQLKKQLESDTHEKVAPTYRVSVRDAVGTELNAITKSASLTQLSEVLPSKSFNKYHVVVVKDAPFLSKPLFAPNNNIIMAYNGADAMGLSLQINHLIKNGVRETTLKNKVDAAQGMIKQRPDKNSMRSLGFYSMYDLAFTLIVPEPDVVNVQWEIEEGIHDYLDPLRHSVEEYAWLSVSSQVLYLSSIGGKPKKRDNYHYLEEQDLPHIINPLESKLGSHATNNPALNFIVYIPKSQQSPLYLLDKSGNRVSTNSFLSPRWGGVLVYNWKQETNDSQPLQLDMHHIMEVFVSQVRLLLDIPLPNPGDEFQVFETGSSALTQWELSGWLRSQCVENIAKVTNTLNSLAQLLEKINNIVINDDIGKEVEIAVESLRKSHQYLMTGELKEAFLTSRNALEASEKAFFHPSLLGYLYFPEDQKFAIYIPLFLPISIPIVSSVLQAIKWFRQRKEKKD